ncbi:MAG: hypothetical protein HRT95_04015 [Moritella sp.]|uniref:hypothetical protein n=1 Tax=Moritella sp. TaxID=78556 RepID=UPI001DA11B7B|nr:hypothetical protein [Moritella sp.]NQZ49370.1 hypothetical protein [Moritella sp.]
MGNLAILKLSSTVQQDTAMILDVGIIVSPICKYALVAGWGLNKHGEVQSNLRKPNTTCRLCRSIWAIQMDYEMYPVAI